MTTTIDMTDEVPADNATLLRAIRAQAESNGYRMAVIDLAADQLDLLAVPWSKKAHEPSLLVQAICRRMLALTGRAELAHDGAPAPRVKPHGRVYFMIQIGGDRQIKLNVMSRKLPDVVKR